MLGLSHGVGQATTQVAAVALGAGALQGVGEAATHLYRRWRHRPQTATIEQTPPEPTRQEWQQIQTEISTELDAKSPWGAHPLGARYTREDLDFVARELDRGVRPVELAPPRAAIEQPLDAVFAADPALFKTYTDLIAQSRAIRELAQDDPMLDRLAAQVWEAAGHDARDRVGVDQPWPAATRREPTEGAPAPHHPAPARAEPQATGLEGQPEAPPQKQPLAQQFVALERERQQLLPLIERAYARSQGRFLLSPEDAQTVAAAVRSGEIPTLDTPAAPRAGAARPAAPDAALPEPPLGAREAAATEDPGAIARLTAAATDLDVNTTKQVEIAGVGRFDLDTRVVNDAGEEVALRDLLQDAQRERQLAATLDPCARLVTAAAP